MPSGGGPGGLTRRCTCGRRSRRWRRWRMGEWCMNDRQPERLRVDRLGTPIGEALVVSDEAGCVRAFDWADREASMVRLLRLHYGALVPEVGAAPGAVMGVLRRYFEGEVGGLGAIE